MKQEFFKLIKSLIYFFKLLLFSFVSFNLTKLKPIITFIYRQYLFDINKKIKSVSLFNFLSQQNYDFQYIVYNHYVQNKYEGKVSCLGNEEAMQLTSLVQFIKPRNILEIGSNKGGTTYNLFLNSNDQCNILTVDKNPINFQSKLIQETFQNKRIKTLTINTSKLYEVIAHQRFDLIFVDAGHSYGDIKNDTEIALKVIEEKGIIIWHDYCRLEPEVVHYLEDLSDKLNLIHIEGGTLVVYYKN